VQPLLESLVQSYLDNPLKEWSDIIKEEIRAVECKIAKNKDLWL